MHRVAFDGQSSHGGMSGLGVYTTSLARALRELSISDELQIDFIPEAQSPFACPLNTPRRLQWEVFGFPSEIRKKNYDLAHIPAFAMGWPRVKTLLTVHDLIGMTFPNQAGIASRFYWGQWLPWAAKRADHLVVDSESTRRDLIKLLRIPEKKISLILPSGHEHFTRNIDKKLVLETKEKLGIIDNYFVFVGTLEPRKNLPRVIQAFKKCLSVSPDHQLVLIGSKEFDHGNYAEQLKRENNLPAGRILTPGYIDHASLNNLYCGATALLFPSLYEGFGFPILEAMASGCPVITSSVTSTPEVAGQAAILVDPYSVEEIANAMQSLTKNESFRQSLQLQGLDRIKTFSWKRTAQEIINLYKVLL